MDLMALVLSIHENENKDKHVESLWFPRLDEGSIPSSSTKVVFEILERLRKACKSDVYVIYEPFLLVESLGAAGGPRIWKTMAENVLNLQRTFCE